MATDGCGTVIDCGMGSTCPTGQVCGNTMPNVCGGGDCPAGSQLPGYVLDLADTIYSFDPPTKTFTPVATPDCDASNPNSMAIDRNLVAWINYISPGASAPNDYIYKFDLKTGTGCQPSGIAIPPGYTQVGMGFSSDVPGGNTETLYVDGIGGAGLASVDMTSKTIVPIGGFANDLKLVGQSCEGSRAPAARSSTATSRRRPSSASRSSTRRTPTRSRTSSSWASPRRTTGRSRSGAATSTSTRTRSRRTTRRTAASCTTSRARASSTSRTSPTSASRSSAPGSPPARRPRPASRSRARRASAQCGPVGDGCGNIIMCGTCPSGQACVAGACVPGCTPKTCAGQGFACGMQGDACGDAINCGTCPPGQSCNGGACTSGACTPKTCAEQDYGCGSVGDGCGEPHQLVAPARRERSAAG